MRITLIHPAIGHRRGEQYIRSWQMEPLPVAALAGLTPRWVELAFHDDRLEPIPYDEGADAVAISIETYTARRAYQIASVYRKRGVPVIMGGFHATLCPQEVERYAEAVVQGEVEDLWPQIIDDLAHRTLQKRYSAMERPDLARIRVDRSIFAGKRYLPIRLIEAGRGCRFPCDFCAIQTFYARTHRVRPAEHVMAEIDALRGSARLFFIIDDNFAGHPSLMRPLLEQMAARPVRWITQMSINAAHDEEFLSLMRRAGCQGVLIGFESLSAQNLASMNKRFNAMQGGYSAALAKLRRAGLHVYGTFVFGYDFDEPASFDEAVDFALAERLYIAAFNHLTPFPGTPLYERLRAEERLHYEAWWLDPAYRYNEVPFTPRGLAAREVTAGCVAARRRFYSLANIARRGLAPSSLANAFMWRNFWPINFMHRADISARNGYPLGDETYEAPLLEAV